MSQNTLKRVLVTGGAGYIGSHIVLTLLLQRRYKVISIDNHHNSLPLALLRVSELAKRELPPNPTEHDKESSEIDAYTGDLTNPSDVEFIFKQYGRGGIWGVIHVAALKAVGESSEEKNPFIAREEFFMNRIIRKNNAVPPWVELQSGMESSLDSFRQILSSAWVRHAVRNLWSLETVEEITPEFVGTYRDSHWEIRERSFHTAALKEVNALIRNYNNLAPYAVRKAYVDLASELDTVFRKSQNNIFEDICYRRRCKKLSETTRESERERKEQENMGVWEQFRRWVYKFQKASGS